MCSLGNQCKPDDEPVIVLVRYGCSVAGNARNSFVRRSPISDINGAELIGMANTVEGLEGEMWRKHMALSVFSFPCETQAVFWLNHTTGVKQPDWLGGVDIISVPINGEWDEKKRFIEIMEIDVSNQEKFDCDYVPKARDHLQKTDGKIGTVASSKVTQLRGNWCPKFMVINQFDDREQFFKSYDHDDYKPIKAIREEAAQSNVVVCQIESLSSKN